MKDNLGIVSSSTNRLYISTKKYPKGELIMGKEVDKYIKKKVAKLEEDAWKYNDLCK